MLSAAGFSADECEFRYVVQTPPPRNNLDNLFANPKKFLPTRYLQEQQQDLLAFVESMQPELIICLGALPFWAFSGKYEIRKWRGSQLRHGSAWLMPIYPPEAILSQWILRSTTVQDLRKCKRYKKWEKPNYEFIVRPSFETVMEFIDGLETASRVQGVLVSGDVETRGGHIACFGIGVSATRAMCIPFMDIKKLDASYWLPDEEVTIVQRIVKLFRNPSIRWIFQNGTFDFQYFARYWGTVPHLATDTMLEHHVAWAGDLPKGLDFLSSMYCAFHVYWKEDGKLWDPRVTPEEDLWTYNCRDCVVTWEVGTVLAQQTAALGLEEQVRFQIERQFTAVLRLMLRGVRCDRSRKANLSVELGEAFARMQERLHYIACEPLNVKSPKQMATFFYETLGLPTQRNRKTGGVTTDAKALPKICNRAAWTTPIVDLITEMRSVGVFKSTFIDMSLDEDNRIRCSYGIAGTETFRYNSSENAFGSGTNLQNIPDGKKKKGQNLPNVKNIFLPDPDMVFAEIDLAQADAQVVAWEANDDKLKYIFRNGIDLHLANASDMYDLRIKLEDLADPEGIKFYSEKYPRQRQAAKAGCHAVNYTATAYTLAGTLGVSVRDAQAFIDKWFSEHPGIRDWQTRIDVQLQTTREVRNAFGFRRYYFDRVERLLSEAVAWIPQSTVALVIDNGFCAVDETLPEVECLLQVHDSLALQFPYENYTETLPKIHQAMTVPIPYPDPLIIPVGLEVSRTRWGAKQKIAWDYQGEISW